MFKSGLEEKVSDLLCELGVDYEYEGLSLPYTIKHLYTPDFVLPNGIVLETRILETRGQTKDKTSCH